MAEFSRRGDAFTDFLRRRQPLALEGTEEDHAESLVCRNFLLDEGVTSARAESYAAAGAVADHASYPEWTNRHGAYLTTRVFCPTHAAGPPSSLDPNDIDCPETFQTVDPASPYLSSFQGLDLVRVEEISSIAQFSSIPASTIEEIAERATSEADRASADEARRQLDHVLAGWETKLELRPTFAGFWEDVAELFGASPKQDNPDWANRLRDRFGLFHLDPVRRAVPRIPILVFRYPVSKVPILTSLGRELRPLVVPTVLDGMHSAAFCPPPANIPTGCAVELSAASPPIPREVVHPTVRFRARQLWRLGRIDRSNTMEQLKGARGWHLYCLREEHDRPDYAEQTDPDLIT